MVASSVFSTSSDHDREPVDSHVRTYNWPPWQLNLWIFVMLLASCTVIGVFASFIQMQAQVGDPIPWYFPYYITVGGLTILYIGGFLWLIAARRLLPAIVMIGAFMLFVMWLVGLAVVGTQLWGPNGAVQSSCNAFVFNQFPTTQSLATLAWMQQRTICQSWQLVFAMGLTGTVFLVWVMVMAYRVFAKS